MKKTLLKKERNGWEAYGYARHQNVLHAVYGMG